MRVPSDFLLLYWTMTVGDDGNDDVDDDSVVIVIMTMIIMMTILYLINVSAWLWCTVKTTDGRRCHFPFTYRRKVYHKCTSVDHDKPWCSTSAHFPFYNNFGRWGNCEGNKRNVGIFIRVMRKYIMAWKRRERAFPRISYDPERIIKNEGHVKGSKIWIFWQEIKNRFLYFFLS